MGRGPVRPPGSRSLRPLSLTAKRHQIVTAASLTTDWRPTSVSHASVVAAVITRRRALLSSSTPPGHLRPCGSHPVAAHGPVCAEPRRRDGALVQAWLQARWPTPYRGLRGRPGRPAAPVHLDSGGRRCGSLPTALGHRDDRATARARRRQVPLGARPGPSRPLTGTGRTLRRRTLVASPCTQPLTCSPTAALRRRLVSTVVDGAVTFS
jgi:hypothetical protein